jgi:hypothetical protein
MESLSEEQIIDRINRGIAFSACIDSGAFSLSVERYQPLVVTAIHDGNRVAPQYREKMRLGESKRRFEEDPYTGDIAVHFPISVRVHDSRYSYDLNRSLESSIYEQAWGEQVWRVPPSQAEQDQLRSSHAAYYRVLQALLDTLQKRFKRFVLYDLHSYNYSRIGGSPPLFNIGTHFIDRSEFEPVIAHLLAGLRQIRLPDLETRAVCDEVFLGQGYQAAFVSANYPRSLCLPLELKKVFMDEQHCTLKEEIFEILKPALVKVLQNNSTFFIKHCGIKYGDLA